ncbi:MAG TPA: hypothetical protein VKF38_12680 [Anaerolineaceae bacterium]|nr:hypothetical protein [Anaerolineaceae bacterium]
MLLNRWSTSFGFTGRLAPEGALMVWDYIFTSNYYVEFYNETVMKAMWPIIDIQEVVINNIGKPNAFSSPPSKDSSLIPLPNGWCSRPSSCGKCGQGNGCYCYSSQGYVPIVENLPLYKLQFKQVCNSAQFAKDDGNERYLELLEPIALVLKNIICLIENKLNEALAKYLKNCWLD